MKKNTLYFVGIMLLLILNLVQLGLFVFRPNPMEMGPRTSRFEKEAIHQLQLDKTQAKAFSDLAKTHHHNIEAITVKQRKYTQLYFENPSDSTLHQIALMSNQKFEETAKHFKSIQALLRPDQQENFQKFKQRTIQHITRQ